MVSRCLLAALIVALATLSAAEHTAWFGVALPPPVSDPRKPIMKYEDVFPPTPVHFVRRPGEPDALHSLLGGTALKADQKSIVGFSLASLAAGDKVWGRRAATPSFMHTIEWAVSQFKSAGLSDAKVETFAIPGAMPRRASSIAMCWSGQRHARRSLSRA